MTSTPSPAPPNTASRSPMRRVIIASTAGSTLEFYDFIIYGTAAALVFPTVFFPALGGTAGLFASFATLGVAFIARPLGGLIFGHYGDRIGRKKTLLITLSMMGLCTLLIGLLPTPETIGVAAPVLLVLLRVVQGIAVGGEWAGAVLLATEYSSTRKRGIAGSFPQMGGPLAFSLASGTFLVTSLVMGDSNDAFLSYGWRIPFILSIVLVALGIYMRFRLEETPVFAQATQDDATNNVESSLPFSTVFREQWREVIIGAFALIGTFCGFYLATAFLTSYATGPDGPGLSRPSVLAMGVIAGLIYAATTLIGGLLSDKIGRKNTILGGTIGLAFLGLGLFQLIDIGTTWSFGLALGLITAVLGFTWGPAGSLLAELFHTKHRYTGAGASYNLAAILGGATTPLIATSLISNYASWTVGILLTAFAVVSLIGIVRLPETRDRELSDTTTSMRNDQLGTDTHAPVTSSSDTGPKAVPVP